MVKNGNGMSTSGISRKGDALTTGHDCVATTTLDTPGQSSIYVNSILAARKTDSTVAHPFPPNPPCADHTATVGAGATNVYFAGKKVARINDAADAGNMTEGSETVFAGDA